MTNLNLIKNILVCLKENSLIDSLDLDKNVNFVSDRLGHDKRYAINSTKISKLCDWKPLTSLHEGIEKTVFSYLEHKNT